MACWTLATAANRAARLSSSATSSVVNELHRHRACDYARLDAFLEEKSNGLTSTLAVVERPVVDVHADECVSLLAIEVARVAHCVVERVLAVVEAVGDALAQMAGDLPLDITRHVLADDVASKWKRQAGLLQPPGTHVGDEMQSFVLVGQLAFVNEKTSIDVAAQHSLFDLIERNNDWNE